MQDDEELRAHLAKVLDWGEAHVDFDAAVEGIPANLRGVRPEGLPWSPFELLEHMRRAQQDLLEFCTAADYREKAWPRDYWPDSPEPAGEEWEKSVAQFRRDRRELQRLASDPGTDLLAPIPRGTGQTVLRELLLAADHAAYHVGELVAVRRLLGVWRDGGENT